MKTRRMLRTAAWAIALPCGAALADAPGAPLGSKVDLVDVGRPGGFAYDIAQFQNGDMLVAWTGYLSTSRPLVRRVRRDGAPIGAIREVSLVGSYGEVAVAVGKGGAAAVVWQGTAPTGGMALYLRRINTAGAPAGADIVVDTIPYNDLLPPLDRHRAVDVAIAEAGNIAVLWSDPITPYLNARFYSPFGTPLGPRIAVGSNLEPVQELAGIWSGSADQTSVQSDRLGNFLVSWLRSTYDGTHNQYTYEPFHRRLGPGGAPIGLTRPGPACVAPAARGDYFGGASVGGFLSVQRYGPLGSARGDSFGGGTPGGCDQMLTDEADHVVVRTLSPGGTQSAVHMFSPLGALLASVTFPWTADGIWSNGDELLGVAGGQIVHTWQEPGATGTMRLVMQRYAGPQGGFP